MQLIHSLFADNILVPFHFWWRETVLKRDNSKNILSKIVIQNVACGLFCNNF